MALSKEDRNKRVIDLYNAGHSYQEILNVLEKEGWGSMSEGGLAGLLGRLKHKGLY